MKIHEKYIKRCIEIGKNGLGTTRPNPMVGCVIVHNNTIIGEGFTSPYGSNHAEVNAINSVKNKVLLKESTLYVTLEPCSHFGKTPPCSDLIIKSEIPQVVIGTLDTNSLVAGKGIEKLEASGCKVTVGVLEQECKEHHKRFFTFHNKKRPYVILKWAQTVDGFIAPINKLNRMPVWITNPFSRQLVHKWRAEEQAILVGTKTVLADNPSLTTREWTGHNPVRVVLDRKNKLDKSLNIFNTEAKTLVVSENEIDFEKPLVQQICNYLYKENIQSIIVEGGTKTIQSFLDEDIWDEARIFTGTDMRFKEGVQAPILKNEFLIKKFTMLNDTLKYYIKRESNQIVRKRFIELKSND